MEIEVVSNQGSNLGDESPTVIKVVGCGGGGSNAVNRMIEAKIPSVDFIALNTDLQALKKSLAPCRLAIGQKITQGLGCGGDPSIGEKAAEEDKDAIANILKGSNMVFVTAGMGGGTGTGSAPVVARIAKELGALTVAIVTTPFAWEGNLRMKLADEGLKKLSDVVDSIIVIPNRKIPEVFGNGMSFYEQYRQADDLLRQGIEGMSTIITRYGVQNIDFADVRSAMKGQGTALFGIGVASGENRAVDAATKAIHNPILEDLKIDGAKHFLINVIAGTSFSLNEMSEITGIVCASASANYELKQGFVLDESMEDNVSVTVIATGFDGVGRKADEIETETAVTESKVVDSNVMSNADFQDLLGGKSSDFSDDTPSLFSVADENSSSEISYPGTFNTVKPGNVSVVDPNDLGIPAALRRNRELSREIKFNRK